MQEYVVNRPDEEAMERALLENPANAAGTVLRLAWQAGLLRDEIQHLTPLSGNWRTGSRPCGTGGTAVRRLWFSPTGTGNP